MFAYRWGESVARAAVVFAAALMLSGIVPVQASAQGLFDAIFGGIDRAIQRELRPVPRISAYSAPSSESFGMFDDSRGRRHSSGDYSGASSGYCVRTCDGRYFPVKANGGMSAAELCKSFCPAAKTKVFGGSKIDYAVAGDGQRYADLDNAFLYRERKVANCTCNGKDAFGLATLDTESDPTLRSGDIVATDDGLKIYNGNGKSQAAEFTPIEQSSGSSEWRRRLMAIKVTPAPPRAEIPPVTAEQNAERNERRRAQR